MSNPSVGKNTLQGHIYYPSGHPLDRRLRVEITSVQNGSFSTLTSDNGAFSFYRLGDATYNLTIDAGPDYEPVTESIPLDSGDKNAKVGQTITLQIQLKPRSSTTRPSVNNAELSGVPPAARELYTQAMSLALARDHKGAIEKLEKAVSINYGYVLLLEKKYTEAEVELHRASDKNANSVLAHLYRARALIRLQRDDEAEKELKRAIDIGGDEANLAHRYLGALYMQRHDNAQAISELETYLRLTPKADDANQIREIIKELRLTSQSK
jgi:tetratricopeptide (TPR) repeat protein